MPRGRVVEQDGTSREFRSAILPRYARRARQVDEAILGAYLAGANTRRIRKTLSPLLGTAHLSKSTISRVVGRLKKCFESWSERDLSGQGFPILYLDGFHLMDHCPVHARDEMKRDYNAIVLAPDGSEARAAYTAFARKWSILVPAVAKSLQEAGLSLLTFYEFPRAMWKTLRTTNPIENLNREFRRRTKTQGSFCTEAAGVTLLWGLVAFGQIRMRRIDGYHQLPQIIHHTGEEAA